MREKSVMAPTGLFSIHSSKVKASIQNTEGMVLISAAYGEL